MAVVSVQEIWDGREGSMDEAFVRRYTRVFRVTTNSTQDGPETVLNVGASLPLMGQPWNDGTSVDVGARCVRLSPSQDQDNPMLWLVRVEYTSETPSFTTRDPTLWTQDPLGRPAEVEWDFEAYKRVAQQDQAGNAILNSAGDPYDPPLEVDDHRLILKLAWNQLDYDPQAALGYQDAVNSDQFAGADPGFCKIRKYKGKLTYETGLVFYRMECEIEFRDELIQPQLLDAGYQVISGGKKITALDQNGQPYSHPVLLDGAGGQLAVNGVPVLTTYAVYRTVAFGSIGLPDFSVQN